MVSKCANPECLKPLQYLREGKVFRIEVQENSSQEVPATEQLVDGKPLKRFEHFWLCGYCAHTMKVIFNYEEKRVIVVPKERTLYRRAALAS